MKLIKTLNNQGFSKIEIDQIFNYLETLDYEVDLTRYIGRTNSKNERLAKYFFLRDKFKIEIDTIDESTYINEILDQCIDWSEFWRLLVVKRGFCCISLCSDSSNSRKYVFLSGPNVLCSPSADLSDSIYEDEDEY